MGTDLSMWADCAGICTHVPMRSHTEDALNDWGQTSMPCGCELASSPATMLAWQAHELSGHQDRSRG